MVNETLSKILCHNVVVLIREICELGIGFRVLEQYDKTELIVKSTSVGSSPGFYQALLKHASFAPAFTRRADFWLPPVLLRGSHS